MWAVLALPACSARVPLRTTAAAVEPSFCAGAPVAADELRTLKTLQVVTTQAKVHVDFCSGAGQVFGVKLRVRPPPDMAADALARMLRCHDARALLGLVDESELPDDPFFLPDSWVDTSVVADAGDFVITLNGGTVADNLRVLRRAQAYAGARGVASLASFPRP